MLEKLRSGALKSHFNIVAIDVTLSIGQKRPFTEVLNGNVENICDNRFDNYAIVTGETITEGLNCLNVGLFRNQDRYQLRLHDKGYRKIESDCTSGSGVTLHRINKDYRII